MDPYLEKGKVIVEDMNLGSTLLNKGCFGEPKSGGGSRLTLIEAAYLLENGRLTVKRSRKGRKISLPEMISRGLDMEPTFIQNLMVYRDLRNRGLVVLGEDGGDWTVFPRGKRPSNGRADTWINVYREYDRVSLLDLWKDSRSKEGIRMKLVGSIVDTDWDVTHYVISPALQELDNEVYEMSPGKTSRNTIPGGGSMLSGMDIDPISKKHNIGTDLQGAMLLSPEEDRMLHGEPSEDIRYRTYKDLREKGWLPRTGFKYGAHYRVYTENSLDDHSRFLVHCVQQDASFTWEELSRIIRLSHSVRKRFLFSIPSDGIGEPHHRGDGPIYLEIAWTRL